MGIINKPKIKKLLKEIDNQGFNKLGTKYTIRYIIIRLIKILTVFAEYGWILNKKWTNIILQRLIKEITIRVARAAPIIP